MFIGTNNYEHALKKVEIAEETSDVEQKWQEWVQRDRNSRRFGAKKEYYDDDDDDDSIKPKKLKKHDKQYEEKSQEEQVVKLFSHKDVPLPPPEILIKSSENSNFSNLDNCMKSSTNITADDESATKSTGNFK